MKEFYQKLYKSNDISPWLINYNYNVLMSVEKNAILITNGDNDSYPAWMLQNVFGIRKDVSVLNISFSTTKTYLKYRLKEKGISVDRDALMKKSFITGPNSKKPYKILPFLSKLPNNRIKPSKCNSNRSKLQVNAGSADS